MNKNQLRMLAGLPIVLSEPMVEAAVQKEKDTNVVRLIAIDNMLHFPTGGYEGGPSLLLQTYDAGDCDTCPWPMKSSHTSEAELKKRLAAALYDEHETNDTFPNHAKIELPDGTPFDSLVESALEEAASKISNFVPPEAKPTGYGFHGATELSGGTNPVKFDGKDWLLTGKTGTIGKTKAFEYSYVDDDIEARIWVDVDGNVTKD